MSNRLISENTQLMYHALNYTEENNLPGLLLLVDFHKAFDSISWEFIEKVLEFLNFGTDFRKYVKLFYTDIQSCVCVNGKYSEYFDILRGVRQGDPLSPYLFLICAEILAQMLRENQQIKGLKIGDMEAFLSQFADDTAVFMDGTEESFNQCIRNLSYFAEMSGLSINFQKSVVVWLGSKRKCGDRFMRDRNFTWDPGGLEETKFKYLGIMYSTNTKNIIKLNFESKMKTSNDY